MSRLLFLRATITVILFQVSFSHAILPEEDQPKKKVPKVQVIEELVKIRNKNLKKIKSGSDGVLKIRSADFDKQYFIGGDVQNYVQRLSNDLIDVLADDFPDIHQQLLDQIEVYVVYGKTLNAHASHNNIILLTSQWIMDAKTEGEIVAVLAHEIAHIILKHPDTSVDREGQAKSLEKFVQIATVATYFANIESKSSGDNVHLYLKKSGQEEIANAVILGALMNDVKLHYMNTRVSRKNEEQADYLATDLMEIAGVNPDSAKKMLQLLHDDETRTEAVLESAESLLELADPFFQSWVSHELTRLAGDDVLKLILAQVVQQYAAKVANKFSGWLSDKRRSHMKAAIRYYRVDGYISKYEYGDYPPSESEPGELSYDEIKNQIIALYNEFELLEIANNQIDLGEYNKAEKNIKEAWSNLSKKKNKELYQPAVIKQWVVRSKLRIAQGKNKDAVENACLYIMQFDNKDCHNENFAQQAEDKQFIIPQDMFVLLAEAYINLGMDSQAEAVIQQGAEYYDIHPFHLHHVFLACQAKDYQRFDESLELCQDRSHFDSAKFCGVIRNDLDVMKKTADEELQKTNPFARVKFEDINWWESCGMVSNRPFSSVKSYRQISEIREQTEQLIEQRKQRMKEEQDNQAKVGTAVESI